MTSQRILRQIDRLLDEADDAIARFDWETVQRCARTVLALVPDHPDGAALLAAAQRALDEIGDQPPPAKASPEPPASPSTGAAPGDKGETPAGAPASFAGNRYRVIGTLGRNSRQIIYLAHDSELEQDVALTVVDTRGLDPQSHSRIVRQARQAAALGDHPGVLPILHVQEEGEQICLAQPLMHVPNLEMTLDRADGRRLPLEQALEIARGVSHSLEFVHSQGMAHGNLKPGNIWPAPEGNLKIGDLGPGSSGLPPAQEGMSVQAAAYLPPEQAMSGEPTPQADLYSLGAVLYEMITGRPPFLGDDSLAVISQHLHTPPVAPTWYSTDCPRSLEALVLRLLAKDPQDRPQSAGEVLASLESIDSTREGARQAPHPEPGKVLDGLAGGIFVGRQRELSELQSSLEDSLSGMGRLIMLAGEPGIGKTRTAQELATYARLRGALVLWGRCHEERGMPPYWPWVQAIRPYVREQDARQLRVEMGPGAVDIAEIIPEVRDRLPDLNPPAHLEPDQARFRLFDSITSFLKAAAQRRPLVIILDNLHWADNASLLLMQFMVQELAGSRIFMVGTYRDADLSRRHPLSQILGELTKDRLFQRVLLRGLGREDVERYIQLTVGELAAGATPPDGLVEAVYRQTEGNPLFVSEVVRLLAQEGSLAPEAGRRRQDWGVRIPEGVREVIGRRLDRLSERCNQALTIASVIGREFTLEQLEHLVEGVSGDGLLEALEEALAARVVEELPQAVGRYQFCHTMIQQTLLEELSTTRRVRLHARIAEVLEHLFGDQAEDHSAELIYHLAEAAAMMGTTRLVHYSSIAGERALQAYAWEAALGYFQQALSAKEGQPTDSETAWLLFGLGRAQAATLEGPRIQEAVDSLRRSFEHYAAALELACAVKVAEYPIPSIPGHSTGMARLIAGGLALVPPDSHEAGRLLANYIRVLMVEEGDYEAAQEAYNRALRIARREGDEALEMRILAGATAGDAQYLRLQGTLVKSLRAIELAKLANEPRTEVDVRLSAGLSLWWMGDVTAFQEQARAALVPAERLRDRYWLTGALWMNEIAASLLGQWDEARRFNERCLAVSPRDPRPRYTRALLEGTLGDFTRAQASLEPLLEPVGPTGSGAVLTHAWTALTLPLLARMAGPRDDLSGDDLEMAHQAARRVLESPVTIPYFAMMARAGLGLLAVLRNDQEAAQTQYEAISTGRAINVPGTFMAFVRLTPSSFMTTARLLGLLARTAGEPEQAASHFKDALAFCRQAGHRPELAWTALDYADFLLAQDALAHDPLPARQLLEEAQGIAQELGMVPLQERAASLIELVQPRRGDARVAPSYPAGLTQREVEVLRLIAVGKSNNDIASELFISLRTVANHVTSILNKVGASNRTEAAIYASRHGLV